MLIQLRSDSGVFQEEHERGGQTCPRPQNLKFSKSFRILVCGTETGICEIGDQERGKGKVSVCAAVFRLSLRLIKTHHTDDQIGLKYLISNRREF